MVKRGGPIDRLFMLSNDGRLLGDAGLDIEYGHIRFATGALEGSVTIIEDATQNSGVHYRFAGNKDASAVAVFGSIPLLVIEPDTELVSGNVAPSVMVHSPSDTPGGRPTLPYVAFHPDVTVRSEILEWFGMPNAAVLGAGNRMVQAGAWSNGICGYNTRVRHRFRNPTTSWALTSILERVASPFALSARGS